MQTQPRRILSLLDRAVIGLLIFVALLLLGIEAARAAEIMPSVGVSHAIEGGENQTFFGLALRQSVAPMLKGELGVAYRSESRSNDDLKVRMVPVTGSLWVSPLPTLYAGGGIGWYYTTLSYRDALLIPGTTEQKFGTHLGGGFSLPIGPIAAIDLNGRYVFMKKQASQLPPNSFDPDFWSTTVGLAIKF